jgi:hypothetical protein
MAGVISSPGGISGRVNQQHVMWKQRSAERQENSIIAIS